MFYIPCVKGEFVFREPAQQKNVDLLTDLFVRTEIRVHRREMWLHRKSPLKRFSQFVYACLFLSCLSCISAIVCLQAVFQCVSSSWPRAHSCLSFTNKQTKKPRHLIKHGSQVAVCDSHDFFFFSPLDHSRKPIKASHKLAYFVPCGKSRRY